MKTKFVLFMCVAATLITFSSVRADWLISDMTSNPSQNWGLGSWQGLSQNIVSGVDLRASEASGGWLELGMGNMNGESWNTGNQVISAWWDFWGTDKLAEYNNHSQYEFDAIVFDDASYASSTLSVKFARDITDNWNGSTRSSKSQNWHTLTVSKTNPDPEIAPNATVMHFVVPYTDMDEYKYLPTTDWSAGNGFLQMYFQFSYNPSGTSADGSSYAYIDNLKLSGPALKDVPEPTTIVMLAMASLLGLLYWRKR
jgi:hypothetical protein